MSAIVKESTIICPIDDKIPKSSLWLSSLDLITRSPYTHTHLLLVYEEEYIPNANFFDTNTLKQALRKVLVQFYPTAGRLKTNQKIGGRFEIDCNSEGVLFVEVETTHVLNDFGDFKPTNKLRKLVFPTYDYSKGLSSVPLLMVQLTRFDCGGVCLGIVIHHLLADGASCAYLINSWARIANGLGLEIAPVHDRAAYFSPRNPAQIKFQHVEYDLPLPPVLPNGMLGVMPMVESHFKFTKQQVNALKLLATSKQNTSYNPSTFDVLAAHIWRITCKARGLFADQDIKLYIPIDGRSRLKSIAFPSNYYGNVIFFTATTTKVGHILCEPLTNSAFRVHQAVKKLSNIEYLKSAIDFLESQPNLDPFVRGAHTFTCPNFTINSWVNIPYNNFDFGWGKPKFLRHGDIKFEGQSYLIGSQNGDGSISLAIKLFAIHMPIFEEYLYDFTFTPLIQASL